MVHTPLDPNIRLDPHPVDQSAITVPYAMAIGSLMYAATGTRPDITYAVQHLAQFTSHPSNAHWTAVKRVFRYMKGTHINITLGTSSDLTLTGYCDVDWAQLHDRRSTSGYLFKIGNGVISWSSKKQVTVALSTMEAEYIALAYAIKEALWLCALLGGLGQPIKVLTVIYCDNQSAISFAHDNQFHACTKHIDIRHHFIREHIQEGSITLLHCASEDNLANMLTKALFRPTHEQQLQLINNNRMPAA